MLKLATYDPGETYDFGRLLGEAAPPGLFVSLTGEMGAGKTLFSQGFAAGLGVDEQVSSPTYTIVNQYSAGRLPLAHMDLFRLDSADEAYERGVFEYFDDLTVVLAEWPAVLAGELPEKRLDITITRHMDDEGNEWREIVLEPVGEHTWLKEALERCESFSS